MLREAPLPPWHPRRLARCPGAVSAPLPLLESAAGGWPRGGTVANPPAQNPRLWSQRSALTGLQDGETCLLPWGTISH